MDARDIKIGTKFEVELPEYIKKDAESSSSFTSQLVDVVDEKTICIASPMREGRFKFLLRESKIIIYYLNEKQELIYFKGLIKGHRKNGVLDVFDVSILSEFNKIQRRRFYRLDVVLTCNYKIVDQDNINTDNYQFEKLNSATMKAAYTKNISASGFCMVPDEPLNFGSILDISINLEGSAVIRALAQLIRTTGDKNEKYAVGLNFIKISPRDSDILTRYIFEKQRQILKNTMLAKLG